MARKTASEQPAKSDDAQTAEGADGSTTDAEAPAGAIPTADIAGTAAGLIDEMPEVQPHAVEQGRAEMQEQAQLDANGETFDPAQHQTLADGTPKKGAKGQFVKNRKPYTKRGTAQSKVVPPGKGPDAAPVPSSKEVSARAGGVAAANLFLMLGVGLGGEEWYPRQNPAIGLDEKAMLETAFGDYFVATGMQDLPPGWTLVAAIGMYALPRFAMPKTRERARGVKAWIAEKYINWRAKREKRKFQSKEERDPPGVIRTTVEGADADSRAWMSANRPA